MAVYEKARFFCYMRMVQNDFESARSNNERLSLAKLTNQCELLRTSLPKDRIYGLVGLLNHSSWTGNKELKVSFKLSCGEIYHQVAMWSMRHERSFGILSIVGLRGTHLQNDPYMTPFWVPDFANPNNNIPFRPSNRLPSIALEDSVR